MSESSHTGHDLRHRTPKERAERGRAARSDVPRSAHAEFTPPPKRTDPVDIIETQSAKRVQELVPIRYGRMSESPFRFYRGAAAIMAADLAETPRTGIRVQCCGDAHMLNFRLLASPERRLMFDINDFDETLPGPWEWDVKRLSASLVIAGRANGFSAKERAAVVRGAVRSYRGWMRSFAGMGNLEVYYTRFEADELQRQFAPQAGGKNLERWEEARERARGHDTVQVFDKLTHVVGGKRLIADDPPLLVRLEDLLPKAESGALVTEISRLVERYGQTLQSDRRFLLESYRVADVARKVVGVGSVGTRCWIVLLLGRDDEDPLFLQAKEADESVLAPYAGSGGFRTQGERVVSGQRLMQATSDIFLGWERTTGIDGRRRDFYVRQLRDWKGIAVAESMSPKRMTVFAQVCGATLARAHARSGDRIAIASYLGGGDVFDRALAAFAELYADQNEKDHQALLDAIQAGRVPAESA
ncbi:DUF2252 domain-containing protein [Streptomyces griseoruber]|uniref:DUF2252 domain-containing protein n=1 Tax=Streptomyces griseoruber TaxID=1943 RepID=A0A101STE3_9ACTN|nr:DUF2252 domain-containing protein [Streptomyces griseoruber]KUN79835.1 hypothetical protein AQJ64_27535 [Streptomyces griseoruber]